MLLWMSGDKEWRSAGYSVAYPPNPKAICTFLLADDAEHELRQREKLQIKQGNNAPVIGGPACSHLKQVYSRGNETGIEELLEVKRRLLSATSTSDFRKLTQCDACRLVNCCGIGTLGEKNCMRIRSSLKRE